MNHLLKLLFFLFITNFFSSCLSDDDSVVACECPFIYQPVCSDDNIEYANACEADCAGATYIEGFCSRTIEAIVLDMGDIALDGCGWVVQFELDGIPTDHRPDILEEEFMEDGLNIELTYKPTFDSSPCGFSDMIPVVEVIEMKK